MTGTAQRLGVALAGAVIASAASTVAYGQRVDPEHPRTLVVGLPAGARADRLDPAAAGRALTLPRGALHAAWRTALGAFVERAPVVDVHGGVYLVTLRGDVVALSAEGTERWRVASGATQAGAPALLSDDTVLFADATGQAIAVREGAVRWRTRFARPDADAQASIPLDDGGAVVATGHEIAWLDADGGVRAQASLPEPPAGRMLWNAGRVLIVGSSGAVWSWGRGPRVPERIGAFPSPVDGGAALADAQTLVAIDARDATLMTFDLLNGAAAVRATSSRGGWRGPPAVVGTAAGALVLALSPGAAGSTVATAIDGSGEERQRAVLRPGTLAAPVLSPDGGAGPAFVAPTPPIVDASASLAFATLDGAVGIARLGVPAAGASSPETSAEGTMAGDVTDRIADACPVPLAVVPGSSGPPRAVVALAALPGEVLLVVCRSGAAVGLISSAGYGAIKVL